jgi:hypothetical protein
LGRESVGHHVPRRNLASGDSLQPTTNAVIACPSPGAAYKEPSSRWHLEPSHYVTGGALVATIATSLVV